MSESKVSARKIRANRRNSQKSTGPNTEEGKRISAQNAVTHGVFCTEALLPGESRAMFSLQLDTLIRDLVPKTPIEELLVEHIHTAQWRIRRLQRMEAQLHHLSILKLKAEAHEQLDVIQTVIDDRQETMDDLEGSSPAEVEKELLRGRLKASDELAEQDVEFDLKLQMLKWRFKQSPDPEKEAQMRKRVLHNIATENVPTDQVQALQASTGGKLDGLMSMDQIIRMEQRLENSIHKNLRELQRLREHRAKHPTPETTGLDEKSCASPFAGNMIDFIKAGAQEAMVTAMKNEATNDAMSGNPLPAEELEETADEPIDDDDEEIEEEEEQSEQESTKVVESAAPSVPRTG